MNRPLDDEGIRTDGPYRNRLYAWVFLSLWQADVRNVGYRTSAAQLPR